MRRRDEAWQVRDSVATTFVEFTSDPGKLFACLGSRTGSRDKKAGGQGQQIAHKLWRDVPPGCGARPAPRHSPGAPPAPSAKRIPRQHKCQAPTLHQRLFLELGVGLNRAEPPLAGRAPRLGSGLLPTRVLRATRAGWGWSLARAWKVQPQALAAVPTAVAGASSPVTGMVCFL